MQHGVDRSLAHRHGNLHYFIFAEAGLGGDFARRLLCLVYGLQRRIQVVGEPVAGHK
jgi:hypothetical protein